LSAKKRSESGQAGVSRRSKKASSSAGGSGRGGNNGGAGGRKQRSGDLGRALRTVYDDTLRETVPDDFLDLIGKLS